MISCEECKAIVERTLSNEGPNLFDSSVSSPDQAHGINLPCVICGRTWTLVCHTLSYEGDLIPANAVLEDESDYPALTELEAREAMEGF